MTSSLCNPFLLLVCFSISPFANSYVLGSISCLFCSVCQISTLEPVCWIIVILNIFTSNLTFVNVSCVWLSWSFTFKLWKESKNLRLLKWLYFVLVWKIGDKKGYVTKHLMFTRFPACPHTGPSDWCPVSSVTQVDLRMSSCGFVLFSHRRSYVLAV